MFVGACGGSSTTGLVSILSEGSGEGSDGGGSMTGSGGGGMFTGTFVLPRVLLISDSESVSSTTLSSKLTIKDSGSSSIFSFSTFDGISNLSRPVKISSDANAKRTVPPAIL